jgi:HSP20 family protein
MATQITRSDAGGGRATSPFRLFEEFFNDWALRSMEGRRHDSMTPAVDVLENDGGLLLKLSLPGLDEKDIDVKAEGQVITIKGERKSLEEQGYTYLQQESHHGTFSRSFTLPESVDMENIKAEYRNGILSIMAPRKAEAKPRTIKVNS